MNDTKARPTPGPWTHAEEQRDEWGDAPYYVVRGAAVGLTRPIIARLYASDEGDANARLIAAAPDLLGWLAKAVQFADRQAAGGDDVPAASVWRWFADHAHAAIAEVEGRVER